MISQLICKGDVYLNSGKKSKFKIDCDALTDQDIEAIAWMLSNIVDKFRTVVGIPTGGVRLAKEMERYIDFNSKYHLIVDDVLTTGRSFEKYRNKLHHEDNINPSFIIGGVIFARGQCPYWVEPVFELTNKLWDI